VGLKAKIRRSFGGRTIATLVVAPVLLSVLLSALPANATVVWSDPKYPYPGTMTPNKSLVAQDQF